MSLSQIKKNDICFSYWNIREIPIMLEQRRDGLYNLLESQRQSLVSKFNLFGITESGNCKYHIDLQSRAWLNPSASKMRDKANAIEARLSIGINYSSEEKYIVYNSYYTVIEFKESEIADLQFETYLAYIALIDQFIADWEQEHL